MLDTGLRLCSRNQLHEVAALEIEEPLFVHEAAAFDVAAAHHFGDLRSDQIVVLGDVAAFALAGLRQDEIDWIELNEAFAAQTLAVIQELGLDREKVNPLGSAIALGHPLGATGAIRTATLMHGLRRRGKKYGMVTMCIGTGMGAAGIFEAF